MTDTIVSAVAREQRREATLPVLALAKRAGFREVGVHERHGRVDGAWKDLLIVERLLGTAREG